jgi:UDP-3-O-[3-hydroxymyristoyl] glucosamine N-acyltransferase
MSNGKYNINSTEIIGWLDKRGYSFALLGRSSEGFVPASIFEYIENGFYFLKEGFMNNELRDCCILTSSSIIADRYSEENLILLLNTDEQSVYYEIVRDFFQEKSNGKISNTAIIKDSATIGSNVQIDDFVVIGEATIGDNTIIKSHTVINDEVIVGENVVIGCQSVIGADGIAWAWDSEQEERIRMPQLGGVCIEEGAVLAANTIIARGSLNEKSRIGKNSFLAPGCRLGHGTNIGSHAHLSNNIVTAGNVSIGDNSFVGSGAIFQPRVSIHSETIVGAGAVVNKDTTQAGMTLIGIPAREKQTNPNSKGMPQIKRK